MKLEHDVIAPCGEHHATIIWLHGIGQNSGVFSDLVHQLGLPEQGVRNVFPRAPEQHVSMTGDPARAWFAQNIWSPETADPDGLNVAVQNLREFVAIESETIGANRVILAGFSQGAAMALITGLRYPESLGGIMLYAPYMVRQANLRETRSASSMSVPIWIGHGRQDMVIPARHGGWVHGVLNHLGYSAVWRLYSGGHETFDGAADDLRQFLDDVLMQPASRAAQ